MAHCRAINNILIAASAFLAASLTTAQHARGLPALDPFPNASLPSNGPMLYYNGTGSVPRYDNVTPDLPSPITPFRGNVDSFFSREIQAINGPNSAWSTPCDRCLATTQVLHLAALTQSVETFTNLIIQYCEICNICNLLSYHKPDHHTGETGGLPLKASSCHAQYSPYPRTQPAFSSDAGGRGPYYAQLYAKLNSQTGDMQALCHHYIGACSAPPTILINESHWFSPKPPEAEQAPTPGGKILNVLHLSDTHLDPRYDIGSEANCTESFCCRPYSTNDNLGTDRTNASLPASRYGSLLCDTTADLLGSTFASMDKYMDMADLDFAIFTGDIVSHDDDDQISRAYVEYLERETYHYFRKQLPGVPLFAALGNHDSLPAALNTPNNIATESGHTLKHNALIWNYDLLSSLWLGSRWITTAEAQFASEHYGAYAHTTKEGLRIISLNSDFWYVENIFNYFNFTNPDQSGTLKFLADELTDCEKRGQRAWIIAHVLTGYEGTDALPNPSALFYSIVRRFSPATIAAIFFGHSHQDQMQIFYDYATSSLTSTGLRNTSDVDYSKPIQMSFVGPSITPLTAFNAGYQLLQVDSKTFSVSDVQIYIANMSESLDWTSPVWELEYTKRETHNTKSINWPVEGPLNATFFDKVVNEMRWNSSLMDRYNLYETKSSVSTKNCSTSACIQQKICYIKSGSSSLGKACGSGDSPRYFAEID